MTRQPLSIRRHRARLAAQARGWRAHENPHTGQWMLVEPSGIRPVDPTHAWGDYPMSLTEIEDRLGVDRNAPFVPSKRKADDD